MGTTHEELFGHKQNSNGKCSKGTGHDGYCTGCHTRCPYCNPSSYE